MLIATVAVLALALQSDKTTVTVAPQLRTSLATKVPTHKLDEEEGAEAEPTDAAAEEEEFVPNLDKIHFPNTWASFQKVFGAHLTWACFLLFLGLLTWVYVRFIRPASWFKDILKKAKEATKMPNVGDALGNVPAELDENDITSTLTLVPGEGVYFSENAATKSVGSVYKLSVTNLRIIAQRAETTMFGTCQVGAREDCWPIENVSKVSIITGEFNGHSVSGLIHYCWAYFLVCMGFDLLQAFVLENIEDFLGAAATQYPEIVTIIDTGISVLCNALFIIAIIYAFAAIALVIWPQSLVKVYLKREMEEEGSPNATCAGCCCGVPNSHTMESFTFGTLDSYRAYQAIMTARAGAIPQNSIVSGALNTIPNLVFRKPAEAPPAVVVDTPAATTPKTEAAQPATKAGGKNP